MKFVKMHGCGNDYIYFNCLDNELDNPNKVALKLSDRHFGIGGDGIVMICHSDVADAKMRMFNADGSEGMMCGNAIRCVGKYLYDNGIVRNKNLSIETLSGIKYLKLSVENGAVDSVRVNMGQPILEPEKIPVILPSIIKMPLTVENKTYAVTCVSMGNPHCIIFTDEDVATLDLSKIGPKFENHRLFPSRINTEFVNVIGGNTFKMRVWERGSGETLACGTGSCAVAVACILNNLAQKNTDITIRLVGGDLVIRWTDDGVYMTGKATKVFEGEVQL